MASAQLPGALLYPIPPPPSIQGGSQSGYAVATDGVRTVVGSWQDDTAVSNSGTARVYDAVTGELQFVLPNPTAARDDNFGEAVAISGTRVVVGSTNDDLGATDAGVVHVFDLSSPTPTVPALTIGSPTPQGSEGFGFSLSLSGSLLVVGAHDYDTTFADTGRVWVFDLASATPAVPLRTLDKPGAALADRFGYSVTISGTKVVVGAMRDDTGATDAGSAYVFDLSSATPATPVYTLHNPTPEDADIFGSRVALSGNLLAVGAEQDNTGAGDAGTVYLYDLAGATPALPVVILNNPGPASGDHFGAGLALSGNRLLVGCYLDNFGATDAGSAYVYDVSGPSATLAFSLFNPSPGGNDRFGMAVAIAGTTAVVGAPLDDDQAVDAGATYTYHLGGGTPTAPALVFNAPGPSLTDNFGTSVAVSGALVAVGAPNDDTDSGNAGIVYVYDFASSTPTVPLLTIRNPSAHGEDLFGMNVAMSGSLLAVGAYLDDSNGSQSGSVYVFDLSGPTPTVPIATLHEPIPSASFGLEVGISGTLVVVGANFADVAGLDNAGKAYVYDVASATPGVPVVTLENPFPEVEDRFGGSVAISGTRVVVGTYLDDTGGTNSGCAYVYNISSGTPTVPTHTINNPTPAGSDWFAHSVAISGTRVVVGSEFDNTGAADAGSAYVYDVSGPQAALLASLNNPEPATDDVFGYAVAISGTKVFVGAYLDDASATDSGSAYLYDLGSGTPLTPTATFRNPSPNAGDQFGMTVAIDGTTMVVGSRFDDTVSTDKGYAFVYGFPAEIAVEQPVGTNLTDGSATAVSIGDFQFGTSGPVRVFTVRNTGITHLLNLAVAMSGAHAAEFAVNTASLGASLAPGASATFSVKLTPTSVGLKTAALQISSTDQDENPFDINLRGQSYSATTDTDGDGMNDWQEFQLSALGFQWQASNTALVSTYFATASQNGLYTTTQVQDLNVGVPLLQRHPGNGTFTLTFGVEKSSAPGSGSWVPFPMTTPQTTINGQGKLEFQFTVPDSTAFFRLKAQ